MYFHFESYSLKHCLFHTIISDTSYLMFHIVPMDYESLGTELITSIRPVYLSQLAFKVTCNLLIMSSCGHVIAGSLLTLIT